MRATLIAHTVVDAAAIEEAIGQRFPKDIQATDAEHLTETAGRLCYWSFDRPRPETRRARDYIKRTVLEQAHESIIEHSSATFLLTGVSRSLTHELIRHRHLSFSELSQRYVDVTSGVIGFVHPPALRATIPPWQFESSLGVAEEAYEVIVEKLIEDGLPRKRAREAARAVMPNATESAVVVTGNLRAWRHVIKMRGSEHADAEIRELAIALLDQLYEVAPAIYADLAIVTLDDGREVVE